jgi:hypothetical protein
MQFSKEYGTKSLWGPATMAEVKNACASSECLLDVRGVGNFCFRYVCNVHHPESCKTVTLV